MTLPSKIDFETAVRMTSKGQVFVPKALRERAGLVAGNPARVGLNEAGQLVVLPCNPRAAETATEREARIRAALEAAQGSIDISMSTDDLMKSIRGDWEP